MARGSLTTTSYAILGLLAIKPWTTYELTQQMERSLGHLWPRAQSKLYEEPKKLVEHRLAAATQEQVGRRTRTRYRITPKGRRALAAWLAEPGAGPVLEFEQLVQVFFADHGTKADLERTLAAAGQWAQDRSRYTATVGRGLIAGEGEFPERTAILDVTVRFLIEYYALVGRWSRWAEAVVATWPDDPSDAPSDDALRAENQRLAEAAARPPEPSTDRS